MIQNKLSQIHKNSMIRDFLYKQLNGFFGHEFRDFVGNFWKTHPYVEECIEDMMRVTQKRIYNLYETFDNNRFQEDEMVENKGEIHKYYYDGIYSEINSWRYSIDREVGKVRLVFMEKMEEMKTNAQKMKREEFILYPSYSDFFGEGTKKEATMNLARDEKQKSPGDSKKRKQPPWHSSIFE